MKLRLSKLIEFQIYYLLIIESLISIVGIPSITRYLLDVNLILMAALSMQKIPFLFKHREYNRLTGYIIFYMVAVTAVAFIRLVPTGQILWGIRNNFFFIFFFFICIDNLKSKDVDRIMKNVVRLQIYNVVCILVEFIFMHKRNDLLSGMFGTEYGGNAYLNIYLTVICAYCFVGYIQKKVKQYVLISVILSSIVVATFSEIKFFFFELAAILIIPTLFSSKGSVVKRLAAVALGLAGLYLGFKVFSIVQSDSMEHMTSFESIIEYNSRTIYGKNDIAISRLTAISQVNDYFFQDNTLNKLIGYGLGACESSKTFKWCHSNFATMYEDTGYRNRSTAMIYLETGYIGLILFVGIFVFIMAIALKSKRKKEYSNYATFTLIMSVISLFNFVYNSSLRIEIAYLIFFSLATLFIKIREQKTTEVKIKAEVKIPKTKKAAV